jgi:hypothetical protein
MKNKKLNLRELKVKSFVTYIDEDKSMTAKGGALTITACGDTMCFCKSVDDFLCGGVPKLPTQEIITE